MSDSDRSSGEKVAGTLYAVVGLAWIAVMVWERFDPDGPREAFQRFKSWRVERRRQQAEWVRQWAEIAELPEVEE